MPLALGVQGNKHSLIGVAILVGILLGFGLSTATHSVKFLSQSYPGQAAPSEAAIWFHENVSKPLQSDQENVLRRLSDMVAKTNGFYARDYSLWLGWNNMRYIIETAVLHGRILNRTTIIPSFVYARACEFELETCTAYATVVNRNDAVHKDEWRELPIKQQMSWRIPITLMFNLTHLQQSHSVITTEDYLRLHDISVDIEASDGQWDINTYHVRNTTGDAFPNLHVVENSWYDPDEIVRVDYIPEDMRLRGGWRMEEGDPSRDQSGSWTSSTTDSETYQALMAALPWGRPVINQVDVMKVLTEGGRIESTSSTEEIGEVLRQNGFEMVYTYDGPLGMDMAKDVVLPSYVAVPRDRIRGLYEDFYDVSARVLLVRGELHPGRKPGSLYFTSAESQARFTQTVLYEIRLRDDIISLAEQISNRMFALTNGRLWMSAHMRRGDFKDAGWIMEADLGDHLARIRRRFENGRQILLSMHGRNATVYDVPGAHPNLSLTTLEPPRSSDKYYIATDELDPNNLKYLRDEGAVLISDLLTQDDYREYGWPIVFMDVVALVEQSIMSRSAYFYAHAMSSVAGGVMNLRAGLGMDPRTALLD